MTLQEKVKVLDMLKEGQKKAAVARHFGVNESTIRSILSCEKAIRESVSANVNQLAKTSKSVRDKTLVRMESALMLWIADTRKKGVPMDNNIIREKARQLYKTMAEVEIPEDVDDPEPSTSAASSDFQASKGWFDRFQKRFQLRSISLHGEAASADHDAASSYPEHLRKIIEEKGYKPEQVFNMDETGLFWKKMPSRTYLMKEEAKASGFKAMKDRVTLIMCANAVGFMIKPGLIYRSKNPRALKNKSKNTLPVYWMFNKKAWITKVLTEDWLYHCFVPAVKEYLHSKGLPFKVLLLMDNAGGHHLDFNCEGVQVEYLPPNTTSLIQPMDQGIIRAFKAIYTRNSLHQLVTAMDKDDNFSLKDYWRNFTIANCIQIIKLAMEEMKPETINACWKKLWPESVHDYKGFSPEEIKTAAVTTSVKLAKLLGGEGFDDITEEEFETLIDEHSAPLNDDDLLELTRKVTEEEEDSEHEEEEAEVGLTLERLADFQRRIKGLQADLESWDPHMVRSMKAQNGLDMVMGVYWDMLKNLKKQRSQLPITMFLTPRKKPGETLNIITTS